MKVFGVVLISIVLLSASFLAGSIYGASHLYGTNAKGEAYLIVRELQNIRSGETDKVINNLELELDRRIIEATLAVSYLDPLFELVGFYKTGQRFFDNTVIKYRSDYPCKSPNSEVCKRVGEILNENQAK